MIGTLLRVRYELLQELGESPVFVTYVAHDRVSERNVVVRTLKEPFNSEPEFVAKLKAVVEKSKRAEHPAVSRPLDFDEHNGSWFIVYQYSPGQSLYDRLKRASAFSVSLAVSTIIKVLEGLDAVHKSGQIHGDVSSRNVVVSPGGEAMLLMSGVWESYSESSKAGVEMLPLMAPYISPEVTAGQPLSFESDVYAVGVLLYEVLAGERPFEGRHPVDVAKAHATKPVPSLSQKISAVPEALDKIVQKALAKSPVERYAAAGQMLRDLKLLKDAMRFGKPLKWPLDAQGQGTEQRVGPRLNVVRDEEKEKKVAKKRAKEYNDGAPAWLVYIGILAMIGAIGAIGWWAYFNINAPKTIKVPDIIGISYNEASAQLEALNVQLRSVREEPSEEFAEGVIISVSPGVGRDIKEGSFVNAVVSSGSLFVEVPDLRGKTFEAARQLLSSLDLILSARIEYVRDPDVPKGVILSQEPAMHVQVERQTEITVKISNGDERVQSTIPSENTFVYNLRWQFEEDYSALVKVEMKDSERTRIIHEEVHDPGEWISIDTEGYEDEATFTIYYDGVIVQTITQKAEEKTDEDVLDIEDEIDRIEDILSGDGE